MVKPFLFPLQMSDSVLLPKMERGLSYPLHSKQQCQDIVQIVSPCNMTNKNQILLQVLSQSGFRLAWC